MNWLYGIVGIAALIGGLVLAVRWQNSPPKLMTKE